MKIVVAVNGSSDRINLLLIGGLGHIPVSRFFLDRVSTRLLNHAKTSVLIAC